jgi:hypothetical protein
LFTMLRTQIQDHVWARAPLPRLLVTSGVSTYQFGDVKLIPGKQSSNDKMVHWLVVHAYDLWVCAN